MIVVLCLRIQYLTVMVLVVKRVMIVTKPKE